MNKEVEVKFDSDAYKEYKKLENAIKERKVTKKKPTYKQLLNSINKTVDDLKKNQYLGDLIPKQNNSKQTRNK